VVVNAAGLGSRMGLDVPKALLTVAGRPLIAWQLALLDDVPDVRVVIGYRAAEVADLVFDLRPDAMVVLNHRFASSGTASSLMRGAAGLPTDAVVSLDCDLVVHPEDLWHFINADADVLGVVPVQSTEPVFVGVGDGVALDFVRSPAPNALEWSGLVRFDPSHPGLGSTQGHVFELIRNLLPMPVRHIRAREVDYPEEVEAMEAWLMSLVEQGLVA
jgi:choline kinase